MKYRTDKDSIGEIKIDDQYYWGSNTQRSLKNFAIGKEKMPSAVIRALALIKKCAASVNKDFGRLDSKLADAIIAAADKIIAGQYMDNFPLSVWQTGSGTQSNMNMNEVIATLANESLTGKKDFKRPVHPNDHVNMSQSSNDVFPTAMHIAAVLRIEQKLLPAMRKMHSVMESQSEQWSDIIKIGRTHMQDATPMTLGQEFGAFAAMIEASIEAVRNNMPPLFELAQGATAVGTGINCPKGFDKKFARSLAAATDKEFVTALNKFAALASHDAMVNISGVLNTLGTNLMKIASDIRLLSSGPRCGIAEVTMPANEPGSSIMPGKVNPTQCEAITMVCAQVMGNHMAVSIAGSQGHLQLNVYKPVIIYNVLQSIDLLSDSMVSFTDNCLAGIKPQQEKIDYYTQNSLMLVTALNPHIGYDKAATIAKLAFKEGLTLKQAAVKSGIITGEDFDRLVSAKNMLNPS